MKIVLHRFCKGTIKSVTVSKTKTNKYFVSILTEQQPVIIEKDITQERVLGVDMSFKELTVYSYGTKAKCPMFYRKSQTKLAHVQRNFSRTKVGSKRHEKARLRVARMYEKISNQRKDFLDKESHRIATTYDTVVIEDINMRSSLKYYTTATVGIKARGEKVRPQDVNLNGSLCEARKIAV